MLNMIRPAKLTVEVRLIQVGFEQKTQKQVRKGHRRRNRNIISITQGKQCSLPREHEEALLIDHSTAQQTACDHHAH